jgi:glucose-1-phosphate thymidylyltransferase
MQNTQAISREVAGVILGGGRGTRLKPLTDSTNKHLLPIGGKPMIVRCVEQLLKADVRDILVLIDEKYASLFMDVLKDGSHLGARSLSYVWQPTDGKGLPTAIGQVAPHTRSRKIVVACGDVLVEKGVSDPVRDFLGQESGARMAVTYTADSAGYSVLVTEGEKIVDIREKNTNLHVPALIDIGVYMYGPDVFSKISDLAPSLRGETEIWDLNMKYSAEGNLRYTAVGGWWSDTGSDLKTYREANDHYAKK